MICELFRSYRSDLMYPSQHVSIDDEKDCEEQRLKDMLLSKDIPFFFISWQQEFQAQREEKSTDSTHPVVTAAPSGGRNHAVYPVHARRCEARTALSREVHSSGSICSEVVSRSCWYMVAKMEVGWLDFYGAVL
jgi:hypothetical protein